MADYKKFLEGVYASSAKQRVLTDIAAERVRQNDKWGVQSHPDGTSHEYILLADEYRKQCDRATQGGFLTWTDILTEEFYEALSEEDPAKLRAELVQTAAVAVAWIEDIDRKVAARGLGHS